MTKLKLYFPLIIPFIVGAVIGLIFPNLDLEKQREMISFITGFSQPEMFNIVAPIAVLIFAMYVFVYGQVPRDLSGTRKFLLFLLPSAALSYTVPFFTALLGFLMTYNGKLETTKLAVFSIVGFIYSVVFFVGMLLPAFEGIYPSEIDQKRKIYVLLVMSLGLVTLWQ